VGGCNDITTGELSSKIFATSNVELYDGPNLTNISLDPGDGLNEVIVAIDAALGAITDVNVSITATITTIVGGDLKEILESIDVKIATNITNITAINTTISALASSDIAYDGVAAVNYTIVGGSTKLNQNIEGIDNELGTIKTDLSTNFYTKSEIDFRWDEHFKDWVFQNGDHENESGLSIDIEGSSTYYVAGIRRAFASAATQVLTASKENYVYITNAGAYAIQVEPLGGGTPSVAGMIIWFFLTDGASITAKTDLRLLDPFDGNLICDNTINTTALKDFIVTTPTSGDILQWDGTDFINVPFLGNILPAGIADDDLILFNSGGGTWERQPGSALDDFYIPITGTTGGNEVTGKIEFDTTAFNDIIGDSNSLALIQFDGSNGITLSDDGGSFGDTASFLKLQTALNVFSGRGGSIEIDNVDSLIDIFIKRIVDQSEVNVFSSADNTATTFNGGAGDKFPITLSANLSVAGIGVVNSVMLAGKNMPQLNDSQTSQTENILIEGIIRARSDTRTGAGAISIVTTTTDLVTTGVDALTLADGIEDQQKMIYFKTDGGNGTLTPANFHDGTTITFTAVHQFVWLIFKNAAWTFIVNKGTTIA